MALISCPECDNKISDKALACPKCGMPITNSQDIKKTGATISTVQETSKKFKKNILISSFIFWGSLILIIIARESEYFWILNLTMSLSLIWYLRTRFSIWWHHK